MVIQFPYHKVKPPVYHEWKASVIPLMPEIRRLRKLILLTGGKS